MNYCLLRSNNIRRIIGVVCLICLAAAMSGSAGAAAKRTYFTGTEQVTGIVDPGKWITDGSKIYFSNLTQSTIESTTDPRVSGQGTISANDIMDSATGTGPVWGTIQIKNSNGEWNGYWQGTRSLSGQNMISSVMVTAVGSGAYDGLVGRWNSSGVNVDQTGMLSMSGFIVEAKGGPGDLPFQFSATRTERFTLHPGLVITPPAQPPYSQGITATWEILQEVAEASHLGHSENTGMGLFDPLAGTFSGSGCLTAANGDLVYWVVYGQAGPVEGQLAAEIHFAGGTGRFDAVVGEADATITQQLELKPDQLVYLIHYRYSGAGTIRY